MTKVSLILTVLNEMQSLRPFCNSLLSLHRLPDEVVICDGGSVDGTFQYLQSFARSVPFLCKIFQFPGNIAQGRNAAIRVATYDIVACTDAGCELTPDWLTELISPFESDPEVSVVAGFYVAGGRTLFERCAGIVSLARRLNPRGFLPSARSIAFRRDAWAAVGGFPEEFCYGEDTVFGLRLRRQGFRFAFAPSAIVRWRPRSNCRHLFQQFFNYAFWDARSGCKTAKYLRIFTRYSFWLSLLVGSIVAVSCCATATTVFFALWSILLLTTIPYWAIWSFIGWRRYRDWRALFITPLVKIIRDWASMVGFIQGCCR